MSVAIDFVAWRS